MFENVLSQPAVDQLALDIKEGRLAPAMLFSGPPASGKGTAALELGRIVSCENSGAGRQAPWNCSCPSCLRHRFLVHPDLLCLGPRNFSAEIAASQAAFLKEPSAAATRTLFIRSARKLLLRFNPVLWEDEPKLSKLNPLISSLEEALDDLDAAGGEDTVEKCTGAVLSAAFKLESEGIGESVPIAQIRRAAWWCRLAPAGKAKLLLIENADRMQEGARNSLLKLLEEPPGPVTLVLTSSRPKALLPTVLSRLRPYRFASRGEAVEREVIRRVFRSGDAGLFRPGASDLITAYLETFLPVSGEILEGLACLFAASVAYKAAVLAKKRGTELPEAAVLLGKHAAPLAEAAGLGRPLSACGETAAAVMKGAGNFEVRSLFTGFIRFLLDHVSLRAGQLASPVLVSYNELWKECAARAESAVAVYNQNPSLALEHFFTEASRGMAAL